MFRDSCLRADIIKRQKSIIVGTKAVITTCGGIAYHASLPDASIPVEAFA